MLLRSVDALSARGSLLNLALDDNSVGFQVRNIDGLDPVDAVIASGNFANMDGEQFYNARRQKRNIKITLGLSPDFSKADVKTLRDQLYAYFMPKSTVDLTFNYYDRFAQTVADQNLKFTISGRIESFQSTIFSQDPQVDISILCFKPDFVDPRLITLTDVTTNDVTINYKGTVDTGVLLTLTCEDDYPAQVSSWGISHTDPNGIYKNINVDWDGVNKYQQSRIDISSVPGDKYALFTVPTAEVAPFSILYALSTTSEWITLKPGNNHIWFSAHGALGRWTIQYTNKYGGL